MPTPLTAGGLCYIFPRVNYEALVEVVNKNYDRRIFDVVGAGLGYHCSRHVCYAFPPARSPLRVPLGFVMRGRLCTKHHFCSALPIDPDLVLLTGGLVTFLVGHGTHREAAPVMPRLAEVVAENETGIRRCGR